MAALKDRPQRSVFATLGPMYRSNDSKAWKAAKKAGFIIHKIRDVVTLDAKPEAVFMVYIKRKDTGHLSWQGLMTADQVVLATKDPQMELDVPCVSSGL